MPISDWSSDVCSSALDAVDRIGRHGRAHEHLVHRGFDPRQVIVYPTLEIGAPHVGADLDPAAGEMKFGVLAARQRALELADRVIERKTLFMLDQRAPPADQIGPLDRKSVVEGKIVSVRFIL